LSNKEGLEFLNKTPILIPKNLYIQTGIWSSEKMVSAAKLCDIAIIPSDPNDIKKSSVSSNRLITALALGLPTAADTMNSYKEFSNYFIDIRSKKFHDLLKIPTILHENDWEFRDRLATFRRMLPIIQANTDNVTGLDWGQKFGHICKLARVVERAQNVA
jgi:hypothetical protein